MKGNTSSSVQDKQTPLRLFDISLVLFIIHFLIASPAAAHKITVFAQIEDDVVTIETLFSNNRPVRSAQITLIDEKTSKTMESGKGDIHGKIHYSSQALSRKLSTGSNILVHAETDDGHMAHWTILNNELPVHSDTALNTSIKTDSEGTIQKPLKSPSYTCALHQKTQLKTESTALNAAKGVTIIVLMGACISFITRKRRPS